MALKDSKFNSLGNKTKWKFKQYVLIERLKGILVVAYNLELNDNGNVSSTDAAYSRLWDSLVHGDWESANRRLFHSHITNTSFSSFSARDSTANEVAQARVKIAWRSFDGEKNKQAKPGCGSFVLKITVSVIGRLRSRCFEVMCENSKKRGQQRRQFYTT